MFCFGQPILIKFGRWFVLVRGQIDKNDFEKFSKLPKLQIAQSLDFWKNTFYGIEYISASIEVRAKT